MIEERAVSVRLLERNSVGCSRPRPPTARWRVFPFEPRGGGDSLGHESDALMTTLGCVDHGALPRLGRQPAEAAEYRGTTSADGDEVDPPPVDAGPFRLGDHLAVEVEPLRVVPRQAMPELDEAHQFSRLVGAGAVE